MKIFGFFVDKSKRLMVLVIVVVLLTSVVGVVSGYESGGGCIPYLYAEPDSITADGVSTTTIYFKVTCPGKCGLSLVPDIGTLKLDTTFVEDKPMEATYTAPTTQELGDYKEVTLTFTHRDSGESKSVTISLVSEEEVENCENYCKEKFNKEQPAFLGFIEGKGEYPFCYCICMDVQTGDEVICWKEDWNCEKYCSDIYENRQWDGVSEWPYCQCICTQGYGMRENDEECVPCETICQDMDPRAHYDDKKSKPNECECYCKGKLLEFVWDRETGKCECVTGADPVGDECRCKEGFEPSADGRKCIPCEREEPDQLTEKQKELKDLLEQRIKEATDEKEKLILMDMLKNLMDVPGHKETIIGGWNGAANVIHSILNKGERPSIGDLINIYKSKGLYGDIKKWFDQGLKTPADLVFNSKTLSVGSQDDIDTAIVELKKGEHRTIRIKYTAGNEYSGYVRKETEITIVKGPDGTVTYTLDGLKYFDGRDLDNKLNPGLGQNFADWIEDVHRFGLESKYPDTDRKVIQYLSNRVQREYNANVESNKKRSDQLKKQMGEKAYNDLLGRMKKFTGYGTTIDFIRYALTETGTQAIEADFSKVAITYVEARKDNKKQEWIKNNMNELLFTDIGWKVADDFMVNKDEQILLNQLEKVYQRYKIYNQRGYGI